MTELCGGDLKSDGPTKNYPLGIVHLRDFHNSKEIHRRIILVVPLNSFSKASSREERKAHEGDCFRSDFRTYCLFLYYARMGFVT